MPSLTVLCASTTPAPQWLKISVEASRNDLAQARRRGLCHTWQAGGPGTRHAAFHAARVLVRPGDAPLWPGARPDPLPWQLLAGHHRGVGAVRRLRARPAGLLHAAALR